MNNVKESVDFCESIFKETEAALSEHKGNENIQLPALHAIVTSRLNVPPHKIKEVDPFMRFYVRNHPDYHVTRGAKGGVEKMSSFLKKESDKEAKESAKKVVAAQVAAKTAPAPASVAQTNVDADVVEDES